jgi:hypothetical protein
MSTFDDEQFAEIYPVSFIMRKALSDYWFRIHSLPDSKRYPQTESDWDILLKRHRSVADVVLTEGSRCLVHYTLFDESGFPEPTIPSLDWRARRAQHYDDDQKLYTQSAVTVWSFDTFRPWIIRCSEAELGWISFHSMHTDAIYSPYDGGADIFSLDASFIANMKSRFADWKSPHPTGT